MGLIFICRWWEGGNECFWSPWVPSLWHSRWHAKREVHVEWKHGTYGHWVTALSAPSGKHQTVGAGIWEPFLLLSPVTTPLGWASERPSNIQMIHRICCWTLVTQIETDDEKNTVELTYSRSIVWAQTSLSVALHEQLVLCTPPPLHPHPFIPTQLQWLSRQEFLPYILKGADSFHRTSRTCLSPKVSMNPALSACATRAQLLHTSAFLHLIWAVS